ncbi:hypothetical protein KBTX_04017 [wastewater metagenome]|uniref:Uncharacterized protein n=2 Tax=unclassified sequences TaxID=12908 RepID=A0A5B8RKX5_9ZZZZ|nr:hypothetical protein KBTEX_04017 [uncultured organism]
MVEGLDIAVTQLHGHRRTAARTAAVGIEAGGLHPGDRTGHLAPALHEGAGAHRPPLRRGHVHPHLHLVAVDGGIDAVAEGIAAVALDHLARGSDQGVPHPAQGRRRGPLGQHRGDLGGVRLHPGHEDEAHPPARRVGERHRQQRRRQAQGHVAPAHGQRQRTAVAPVDEAAERRAETLLQPVRRRPRAGARPAAGVPQVRRQDDQRLHQRDGEDRTHHRRDHRPDLAEGPGDEGQRQEGDDIGEHAHHDRHRDVPRPLHRGGEQPQAPLPVLVDVLAGDDGVVHHDAQRDDEREQRDHVDGHAEPRQEQERPEEGGGDTHGHPERQPQLQEGAQHREHQQQPEEGVAEQQLHALAVDARGVAADGDTDLRRQRRPDLREHPVHGIGDPDGRLPPDPEDLHAHRRLAVVAADVLVRGGEGLAHVSHVGEAHHAPARGRAQDDVAKALCPGEALAHLQQDVAARGLHPPGGAVPGVLRHHRGHVLEGEAVGPQLRLADVDVDLVVADVLQRGLGDAVRLPEAVAHPFGGGAQAVLGHVAVDKHVQHVPAPAAEGDLRVLRLVREGVDVVHRAGDVLVGALEVVALDQLDVHPAAAGSGRGGDLLDAFQALHGLLHRQDHAGFDLLRRGPRVGDTDHEDVALEVREDLLGDAGGHVQPAEQEDQHEQVRRHPVAHEPADHAAALTRHRRSPPPRHAGACPRRGWRCRR